MPDRPTLESLAIEIERGKGKQEKHEEVCAERYKNLEGEIQSVNANIAGVAKTVDQLATTVNQMATDHATALGVAKGLAEAKKPKAWHPMMIALVVVFCSATVGLIGWMGSTIWSLEQEKITALQNRPSAQVTVNPAQTTPTTPDPTTAPASQ